jgi:hypothetical protein
MLLSLALTTLCSLGSQQRGETADDDPS